MRTQRQERNGPFDRDCRARLGAVKTPHVARPRLCRVGGLDRVLVEPRTALVDGPGIPRPMSRWSPVAAPSISLTIGLETRSYLALITSAPPDLDAPSTITMYSSAWGEAQELAADDLRDAATPHRAVGRVVLVESTEFQSQRTCAREIGHLLTAVDRHLVAPAALQRWLWRRLATRLE
jgi:hypothetical protein